MVSVSVDTSGKGGLLDATAQIKLSVSALLFLVQPWGVFAKTRFAGAAFLNPCSLVASHPVQHNMHVIHIHEAPDLLAVLCLTFPCTRQAWQRGLGELIWQFKPQCHGILRGQKSKRPRALRVPIFHRPLAIHIRPISTTCVHWAHKTQHLPYLRRFLRRKLAIPKHLIHTTPQARSDPVSASKCQVLTMVFLCTASTKTTSKDTCGGSGQTMVISRSRYVF
jgi:hypothetical protein